MRYLIFLMTVPLWAVSNAVVITDTTGSTQTSRPFSISRVFAEHEIAAYAQPRLNGTPISVWQCDRKNTWASDGSLKHAMISFVATVPANGAITIDFVNNASSSSAGSALNQAGMLAFNGGAWGADIEVTGSVPCTANQLSGNTCAANARTMLTAGNWRYWLQGPVVTQVIVEDRSTALTWDMGWDTYHPLHPIFVLTFYAGYAGVKIEYILENAWTTKRENQTYDLAVKRVSDLSVTAYSLASVPHIANTRWHRTFWDGSTPGSVKTDFGFAYLMASNAVAPYDSTLVIGKGAMAAELAEHALSPNHDIFNAYIRGGAPFCEQYRRDTGGTGGRPELGYTTRWWTRYLYTADPALLQAAMENSECSGYYPNHFRESYAGGSPLYCGATCTGGNATVPAFGRFVSLDAHSTQWTGNPEYAASPVVAADRMVKVGTVTNGGWTGTGIVDYSHRGDFDYMPYLFTGEWYWLEELYNSASWGFAWASPNGDVAGSPGRNGGWGLLSTTAVQLRGVAWNMRDAGQAVFIGPDGDPEIQYLRDRFDKNVGAYEGQWWVNDGTYVPADTTCPNITANVWCFGKRAMSFGGVGPTNAHYTRTYPPIYNLMAGNGESCSGSNEITTDNPTYCRGTGAQWEMYFLKVVIDNLYYMGLTELLPLRRALAIRVIHGLLDPAFNPYILDVYEGPVTDLAENYFPTWAAYLNAFQPAAQAATHFGSFGTGVTDPENGFVHYLRAVAAGVTGFSDGSLLGNTAYTWMMTHEPSQYQLGSNNTLCKTPGGSQINGPAANCDNPKWGLVSKVPVTPPTIPPTITTANPLVPGAATVSYSLSFVATGDPTIVWTATGVPAGLTFHTDTQILNGTPTTPGTYTIHVTASNGVSPDSAVDFTLVINPAPGPAMSRIPARARGLRR